MCEYACSKYIPKSHILRNQMLWFRILVIVKISKSHKHIYGNKNRRMQSTVKKNKDIISAEDPLKGFGSYKVHKLQQIKLQTIFIKELWEIQHK